MWPARRVVLNRVGCALAALIASQAALAQSPSPALAQSLLGDGDTVRISVFQNPDLTTEARISERGSITFPLIGEVVIGGFPAPAGRARIAQQAGPGQVRLRPPG